MKTMAEVGVEFEMVYMGYGIRRKSLRGSQEAKTSWLDGAGATGLSLELILWSNCIHERL